MHPDCPQCQPPTPAIKPHRATHACPKDNLQTHTHGLRCTPFLAHLHQTISPPQKAHPGTDFEPPQYQDQSNAHPAQGH
ncbi:hypothetical protein PGT21_012444 [Puccinia graminis f. sp. tritici]|uniref:Uncharacterized protein n=1 Tax=Puccinia graminis f. sp. tritici TaxID=56615 RepID=A0A5B0LUU5_PUCGR|nr:hypothetical protein PGT21_012444 [Puccinia graminis f. sp. tritici]KAA1103627.1 hypothetical protein PGTUg99_003289 [Puccinia graminis f. sp. tritici]